jgi:Na+/H+ antiporter NhaD/arsenite permease-like protein
MIREPVWQRFQRYCWTVIHLVFTVAGVFYIAFPSVEVGLLMPRWFEIAWGVIMVALGLPGALACWLGYRLWERAFLAGEAINTGALVFFTLLSIIAGAARQSGLFVMIAMPVVLLARCHLLRFDWPVSLVRLAHRHRKGERTACSNPLG